jgi:beta-mannosidase
MTPRVRGHTRVAIDRGWELAATPSGTCREPRDLGGAVWQPAAVPGTAAGVLRAAGAWNLDDRRRFDAEDWWWRVHLPPRDARARLGFDGVATLWDAWLDGEWIAHGDSMHEARVVDLPAAGSELVLRCRSLDAELTRKRPRPRWRVPMIEHVQLRWFRTTLLGRTPGWSPACAAVGPWRAVWIEAADSGVGVVNVEARVEAGIGFVTVGAQLPEGTAGATLVVARGATRVTRELACEQGAWVGSATVREPARWWPHTHGEPARYDLHLELAGGAVIELGAIGFRTIAIDRGADGRDFAVHVNGVPVFCRGACWTPLDPVALAAPRAAYDAAVAQLAAAGLNMLRVGGTMIYEDDALYDALDARGVLLWQDFMFAAMDYPEDDPAFRATALAEVDAQCLRLQARPSLAIACGNSEVSQQAAMGGAIRERWTPPLFEHAIAERVRAVVPGVAYVPSSAHGGEFPHDPGAGTTSYYGVGAYRRGLADARASGVVFASECLAFANIPAGELPPPGSPAWKARVPRDAGASWDFDDVRDHYVHELYGVDPEPLRATDPDRYLALGRAATGEVMARTFAEWRRAGSHCRGALVWFARDLAPGAGWGLVAADGTPKPCWWYVRRACAPRALAISDEGAAGLALHVVNDAAEPLAGTLELALWRGGDVPVGRAARAIEVAPRAALELAAVELFDHWEDLSWAYRFGPPVADLVHLRLGALEAFWFPGHLPAAREPDIGLAVAPANGGIVLTATRFAQTIAIEGALEGAAPDDNYFHLAPGAVRTIAVRGAGTVTALNSERVLVFSAP